MKRILLFLFPLLLGLSFPLEGVAGSASAAFSSAPDSLQLSPTTQSGLAAPQADLPATKRRFRKRAWGFGLASMIIGITGVVLGIIPFVGFVLGTVAIIFAGIALRKSARRNGKVKGRNAAIAGLITGIVGVLGSIGLVWYLIWDGYW